MHFYFKSLSKKYFYVIYSAIPFSVRPPFWFPAPLPSSFPIPARANCLLSLSAASLPPPAAPPPAACAAQGSETSLLSPGFHSAVVKVAMVIMWMVAMVMLHNNSIQVKGGERKVSWTHSEHATTCKLIDTNINMQKWIQIVYHKNSGSKHILDIQWGLML